MSHQARLEELIDNLFEAVTASSPTTQSDRFAISRSTVSRLIRHHSFLPTNPFDVKTSLDGLEERFRVNHRDALADHYRLRLSILAALPTSLPCIPEILHLLLELSDQPTQKTCLENFPPPPRHRAPTPPLQWKDVAREDGWNRGPDASIWRSVDFSHHSDDDSHSLADLTVESASPQQHDDMHCGRTASDYVVVAGDPAGLLHVRETQAWRSLPSTTTVEITELQALRETLFLLRGLSTTIFDTTTGTVFRISGVSAEASTSLLKTVSDQAQMLRPLRLLAASSPSSSPLDCVLSSCVDRALADFHCYLGGLEQNLVAPRRDVIVSMLAVLNLLVTWLDPLRALAACLFPSDEANLMQPEFAYLERLFDAAGAAQITDCRAAYELLVGVFLDCFRIYIRPLRSWIDDGSLTAGDQSFLVGQSAAETAPEQLWESRFHLRQSPDGRLHAPAFLHARADRILTAGKSVVVLRRLGWTDGVTRRGCAGNDAQLEFGLDPSSDLTPFAEQFSTSFDEWMRGRHGDAPLMLQHILFESCGLSSALDALERLYLLIDGCAANVFCASVFDKLDAADPLWNDGHALSDLAREAFSPPLEPDILAVSVGQRALKVSVTDASRSVRAGLDDIFLTYRLPWPCQLVLTADNVASYRTVFTFLLQLNRVLVALRSHRLPPDWPAAPAHGPTASPGGQLPRHVYPLRARLLWFCTTVRGYVASLVIAPACSALHRDLRAAPDVDAMIALHAAFARCIVAEACLSARLRPIRDGILDVLDLALALCREPAHNTAAVAAEVGRGIAFVRSGLRAVARASGEPAAVKWDMLAKMLEAG